MPIKRVGLQADQGDARICQHDFAAGADQNQRLFDRVQDHLHPVARLGDFAEQARVFDGDDRLIRQLLDEIAVFLVEGVELTAFQRDHARDALVPQDRRGNLGAGFRQDGDVIGVLLHVVGANGGLFLNRLPGHAAGDQLAAGAEAAIRVAAGCPLGDLALIVHEQHRRRLRLRGVAGVLHHQIANRLHFEGGGQVMPDVRQRQQLPDPPFQRLVGDGVEPRVADRLRALVGESPQQLDGFGIELAGGVIVDRHHANRHALKAERKLDPRGFALALHDGAKRGGARVLQIGDHHGLLEMINARAHDQRVGQIGAKLIAQPGAARQRQRGFGFVPKQIHRDGARLREHGGCRDDGVQHGVRRERVGQEREDAVEGGKLRDPRLLLGAAAGAEFRAGLLVEDHADAGEQQQNQKRAARVHAEQQQRQRRHAAYGGDQADERQPFSDHACSHAHSLFIYIFNI